MKSKKGSIPAALSQNEYRFRFFKKDAAARERASTITQDSIITSNMTVTSNRRISFNNVQYERIEA